MFGLVVVFIENQLVRRRWGRVGREFCRVGATGHIYRAGWVWGREFLGMNSGAKVGDHSGYRWVLETTDDGLELLMVLVVRVVEKVRVDPKKRAAGIIL